MTLTEYFKDKPRGTQRDLALKLGISKTWLSLLNTGRKLPSPELARAIEIHTGRKVKRVELRPDIFGKTAKNALLPTPHR
jgi:DNA-binding transcriptional regulator YdaS (Cro superfamily)